MKKHVHKHRAAPTADEEDDEDHRDESEDDDVVDDDGEFITAHEVIWDNGVQAPSGIRLGMLCLAVPFVALTAVGVATITCKKRGRSGTRLLRADMLDEESDSPLHDHEDAIADA